MTRFQGKRRLIGLLLPSGCTGSTPTDAESASGKSPAEFDKRGESDTTTSARDPKTRHGHDGGNR